MFNNYRCSFGALLVTYSLAVGLICPPVFAQNGSPEKSSETAKNESKKDKKKDKKAKAEDTSKTPVVDDIKRPLSPDEDPSLIGKRNINKGADKWFGGSVEKEVRIGAQIAAEVEKQMKILDDPIINEYVNRVGQNIVLHSDAKVPFTIKVVDTGFVTNGVLSVTNFSTHADECEGESEWHETGDDKKRK